MNIGFDGKRAANNLTGLGNYSRSLIGQLARTFPQNQYLVYAPKLSEKAQIKAFFDFPGILLRLAPAKAVKFLWRSLGVKKQLMADQVDIYHGLSQEIPFGIQQLPMKTVVTIHDLIYLRYPAYYKPFDRFIYNLKSKYACKKSDRIIAISERTRADIIEFYGISKERIEVVYQSCDPSFKIHYPLADRESVREKYQLPAEFILNVGTIEPRKNLLLLIRAMKDTRSDVKLVVVGKPRAYARQVMKEIAILGLSDRVIFLENVPFQDLPKIYQLASLFAYPSFYEGFGIPIIEALYSAVPVIAATGSCLEEAGGPGSVYIAPDDAVALAREANRVLDDPELRERMIATGLDYVKKFDDELLANQLMDCYTKL